MLRDMKIGTKLIAVGVLLTVLPLLGIGGYAVITARGAITNAASEGLGNTGEELAHAIDVAFTRELRAMAQLAVSPTLVDAFESNGADSYEPVQRLLTRIGEDPHAGEHIQGLIAIGADGVVKASDVPSFVGVDVTSRQYYQEAMAGKHNAGAAALNLVTGEPFVPVASPIVGGSGEPIGVMVNLLNIAFLQALVDDIVVGETGYAFAIDREGLLVAHPDPELRFQEQLQNLPGLGELSAAMRSGTDGLYTYTFDGIPKTVAYAPVPTTRWSVGLSLPDREFLAAANALALTVVIVAVAAAVVVALIYMLFARSLSRPIAGGVNVAQEVAAGDLTVEISVDRGDELGKLSQALATMLERLRTVVLSVRGGADEVSSGSQQLANTAQQLSQGASEQAASTEEVSASMEEMMANIDQTAENSQQAATTARESAESAVEGGEAVAKTVNAMRQIAEKIALVEDIARNTDLLALNAAIEAARAGEHGKGFAVVASEVRKLAERSATAAREISELSSSSVEIAEHAGELLETTVPRIRNADQLVQEISAATREQKTGANQITQTLVQLEQVVQQNASASEQMASMAEELAAHAEELLTSVAYFNTNGTRLVTGTSEEPALIE